jgi:hypothetical protein
MPNDFFEHILRTVYLKIVGDKDEKQVAEQIGIIRRRWQKQ